jgi:SAM-dependent methyltransferase
MDDYRAVNRAMWDERAPAHAASGDYEITRFRADPTHLSRVVRFDLPLLGSIEGQRGLHLQCHIGTDTLSLARLGARMTGLDFSAAALQEARHLASSVGAAIDDVESDAYEAAAVLGTAQFDFVFTGIGAICWLPDIRRWARVVAELLKPGGRLFIREGHPVLWAVEDGRDDKLVALKYPYFEHEEPLVFDEDGTYVETDVSFKHTVSHSWNHGLGEIIMALLEAGMTITGLVEHDSVPWNALPGLMEQVEEKFGEWRLIDQPERLPHSYTLQAVKAVECGR